MCLNKTPCKSAVLNCPACYTARLGNTLACHKISWVGLTDEQIDSISPYQHSFIHWVLQHCTKYQPAILILRPASRSKFSAFKSRWTMWRLWQYDTAATICLNFFRASRSFILPWATKWSGNKKEKSDGFKFVQFYYCEKRANLLIYSTCITNICSCQKTKCETRE